MLWTHWVMGVRRAPEDDGGGGVSDGGEAAESVLYFTNLRDWEVVTLVVNGVEAEYYCPGTHMVNGVEIAPLIDRKTYDDSTYETWGWISRGFNRAEEGTARFFELDDEDEVIKNAVGTWLDGLIEVMNDDDPITFVDPDGRELVSLGLIEYEGTRWLVACGKNELEENLEDRTYWFYEVNPDDNTFTYNDQKDRELTEVYIAADEVILVGFDENRVVIRRGRAR